MMEGEIREMRNSNNETPATEDMENEFSHFRDESLCVANMPERALLRLLATAHVRKLDAAELVHQLAGEYDQKYARRFLALASALSQSTSIVEGIRRAPDALSPAVVIALTLAEDSGTLTSTFHSLLLPDGAQRDELDASKESPEAELVRSTAGIIFAFMVLSFLALFIIPGFKTMFDEFGLYLPVSTRLLLAVAPYIPFVMLAILIIVAGYFVVNMTTIWRSWFSRLSPMAWRTQSSYPKSEILSLLAIVSELSRPIADGIARIADLHPGAKIKRRLTNSAARIECGEEPFASLAAERILTSRASAALALASSDSARAWLLRWFAARRWRFARVRTQVFAKSLSTLTTLFLGLVVAWTAIEVFLVLSSLVSGLS